VVSITRCFSGRFEHAKMTKARNAREHRQSGEGENKSSVTGCSTTPPKYADPRLRILFLQTKNLPVFPNVMQCTTLDFPSSISIMEMAPPSAPIARTSRLSPVNRTTAKDLNTDLVSKRATSLVCPSIRKSSMVPPALNMAISCLPVPVNSPMTD
jgi:hypothetical protein